MPHAPPGHLSRRTFLKRGLVGGTLMLLGGGGGLALLPSKLSPVPLPPLRVLSPQQFNVVMAIAGRVVTAAAANPHAIAVGVDTSLSYTSSDTQSDVRALLGLFENALPGLLLDGHLLPFTRLTPAAQDAVLDRWRKSRVALRRTGYQALRKLVLAAHYAQESSFAAIPYAPPSNLNVMAYDDSQFGTAAWLAAHPEPKP